MRRRPLIATMVAASLALAPAAAHAARPTLTGRAILPAAASWPAPFPAAPDTSPAPAPGARQPVGGFSALIRAGRHAFWAMPDNGFGSQANSRSFILRAYRVVPRFRGAKRGAGTVSVRAAVSLRDPDHRVPWPIVREGTADRLLTGADLDPESMRRTSDGTLWFGDEFGPFLLHTDAAGRLLEAPIAFPGVQAPENPLRGAAAPTVAHSAGFEALALAPDGHTLYPVLENAIRGDGARTRRVYRFDTRTRAMRLLTRYRVKAAALSVSDAAALSSRRLVVLERDDLQGAAARWKRVFVVDLRGATPSRPPRKHEVANLLRIADPARISLHHRRKGDIGLGRRFAFPYETVEALLPLGGERLALVNDTNFGSRGRNPARPDESDFITVRVPGL